MLWVQVRITAVERIPVKVSVDTPGKPKELVRVECELRGKRVGWTSIWAQVRWHPLHSLERLRPLLTASRARRTASG